jgi:hypothetical protein
MRKFRQRVIRTSLPDLMTLVGKNSPESRAFRQEMQEQSDLSMDQPTIKRIVDLEIALKQFESRRS